MSSPVLVSLMELYVSRDRDQIYDLRPWSWSWFDPYCVNAEKEHA